MEHSSMEMTQTLIQTGLHQWVTLLLDPWNSMSGSQLSWNSCTGEWELLLDFWIAQELLKLTLRVLFRFSSTLTYKLDLSISCITSTQASWTSFSSPWCSDQVFPSFSQQLLAPLSPCSALRNSCFTTYSSSLQLMTRSSTTLCSPTCNLLPSSCLDLDTGCWPMGNWLRMITSLQLVERVIHSSHSMFGTTLWHLMVCLGVDQQEHSWYSSLLTSSTYSSDHHSNMLWVFAARVWS